MSHPICERCGKEILPGQNVTMPGMSDEEIAEKRIFTSDELLLVHADEQDCEHRKEV